jgi:hypothetical protein
MIGYLEEVCTAEEQRREKEIEAMGPRAGIDRKISREIPSDEVRLDRRNQNLFRESAA